MSQVDYFVSMMIHTIRVIQGEQGWASLQEIETLITEVDADFPFHVLKSTSFHFERRVDLNGITYLREKKNYNF